MCFVIDSHLPQAYSLLYCNSHCVFQIWQHDTLSLIFARLYLFFAFASLFFCLHTSRLAFFCFFRSPSSFPVARSLLFHPVYLGFSSRLVARWFLAALLFCAPPFFAAALFPHIASSTACTLLLSCASSSPSSLMAFARPSHFTTCLPAILSALPARFLLAY